MRFGIEDLKIIERWACIANGEVSFDWDEERLRESIQEYIERDG